MEKRNETVLVVGAGMVGLSAALSLLEKGFKVSLIDRLGVGGGASNNNACVLSQSSVIPVSTPGLVKQLPKYLTSPLSPLVLRYSYLPKIAPWLTKFMLSGRLEKMLKISQALSGLQKNTVAQHQMLAGDSPAQKYIHEKDLLYVYESREDYEKEDLYWGVRKSSGVECREVEANELRELEPDMSSRFQFAIAAKSHGYISDTKKYLEELSKLFLSRGGLFLRDEVKEILPQRPKVKVTTRAGEAGYDKLVLAGGVWSAKLASKLGDSVPLESEGGYGIDLADPKIEVRHPMLNLKYKMAITPNESCVRFAGLAEFGGVDCSPDYKNCDKLINAGKRVYPNANFENRKQWYGQRPTICDSLPVIDAASKHPHIYYAFGLQHIGLSSGVITGRLISELISGDRLSLDLSPFSVRRFK